MEKKRPGDINLRFAASDHVGVVQFHEVLGTGLSTLQPEYARQAVDSGFTERVQQVPCTTLNEICRTHGVSKVDFLKIDVEGAESDVLRGFAFDKIRPVVLVIEATEPRSTTPSYQQWEPALLKHNYAMVYDDGLNRFYLAKEHDALRVHFQYPPNVHDKFIRPIGFQDVALQVLQGSPEMLRLAKGVAQRASRILNLIPGR